ncbi:MAG: T9SS type A sorting domain-containing protein [Bacteroidia bacterium]|nr:T9SS type A sorting domain-containing protein [Bacteroidia bacterium]
MKKLIFLISLFILSFCTISQTIVFDRTYPGNYNGWTTGSSIKQTLDSGYIVSGYAGQPGDFRILRLNKYGDTLWTKIYGGPLNDGSKEISLVPNGGYIVAGTRDWYFNQNNQVFGDVWILRLNENGDTLWTKTYGGPYQDCANSVKATADNGFIVCGVKDNQYINGFSYIWVLKLDANGDTIWTKSLRLPSSPYLQEASSIIQDLDGGYALTGTTDGGSYTYSDIFIIKLKTNGDTLWQKKINGYKGECIIQTPDSGYVITGRGDFAGGITAKLDHQGNLLWVESMFNFYPIGIVQSIDEGIAVTGYTIQGTDLATRDTWLYKISHNGDSLWARNLSLPGADIPNSITSTFDGGYAITGGPSCRVIKLTPNGDTILNNETQKACEYNLFCHPNPFYSQTIIHFSTPLNQKDGVTVDVFNSLGILVQQLNQQYLSNSNNTVLFDAFSLPAGVYYYSVKAGTFNLFNKMVLIK